MPESIFSGVEKGRYRPAGEADWANAVEFEKIKADSESNPEMPGDDVLGNGDILFAGETKSETVRVYDMDKYPALRTLMIADGKIDFQIQDLGGNWNDVAMNFIPRVRKPNQYATGARRFFELMITKFVIE